VVYLSAMRALLSSLTAMSLAACAGPSDGDVGTTVAPIVGGTLAPDDAAVVLLAAYPSDRSVLATCTASVISDTVLLTAAHCVDHPGWLYGMFPGADAAAYPTLAALEPHLSPVSAVHMHPNYARMAPFTADIAVAILAQPTTIAPLPVHRAALTSALVGQPARIVGYGQAMVGVPSSTRRQAATVVAGFDPDDTVRVGDPQHVTCLGDSGGPALVIEGGVETVIGVDSYADNGSCDQPAHFRRTNVYAPFIDTYVPPAAGPDAGPVTPGADAGTGGGDDSGGCAVGVGRGGRGGWAVVGLAGLVGLVSRRRRRR